MGRSKKSAAYLAAGFALALVACSKSDDTSTSAAKPEPVVETAKTEPASPPAPVESGTLIQNGVGLSLTQAEREAKVRAEEAEFRAAEAEERLRFEVAKTKLIEQQAQALADENARLAADAALREKTQQYNAQQQYYAQQQAIDAARAAAEQAQGNGAIIITGPRGGYYWPNQRPVVPVAPSGPTRRRVPDTPDNAPHGVSNQPRSIPVVPAMPPPVSAMPPPVSAMPPPVSGMPNPVAPLPVADPKSAGR